MLSTDIGAFLGFMRTRNGKRIHAYVHQHDDGYCVWAPRLPALRHRDHPPQEYANPLCGSPGEPLEVFVADMERLGSEKATDCLICQRKLARLPSDFTSR